MVATITPLRASLSPQYKGIEAEPLIYPPPYIQTITGRRSCALFAGVQMLRYRQSSLTLGGVSPGMDTLSCIHAGANASALRMSFQGVTGAGGRQRKSFTGGAANGTPL